MRIMLTWTWHPNTWNIERSGFHPFHTVKEVVSDVAEDGAALRMEV